MERLTTNLNETTYRCAKISTGLCYGPGDCYTCPQYKQIIDRLAAYEDTGLEPEEIDQIQEAAEYMRFSSVRDFVRYSVAMYDAELQALRDKLAQDRAALEGAHDG